MAATLRSIQLWTTIAVFGLAPLFFGSVDLFWPTIWAMLLSASALCGLTAPLGRAQTRVLLSFLSMCGVYALVALIQLVPNPVLQSADPDWARVHELLGLDVPPRISSRAELPPLAAGHFVLFASAFINGFFIGTSARHSGRLLQCARYSILLYAIYGLGSLKFTPDLVLWLPKLAYRGSLTATFINHNTAATFLGAGTILWFCSGISSLRRIRFSSTRLMLLTQSTEREAWTILLRSVGGLICFFALLFTGSRGGLICSALGLLIAGVLMIADRRKRSYWQAIMFGAGGLAVTIGLLSQMTRIVSQGLFDEARSSVYAFCLEAIQQRPWLGSGLGTFGDLMPSFRADDFASWGVWDYAHSTGLEIAVEMGLPVAAMVVMGAFTSLVVLCRAVLGAEGRRRTNLAAITGVAVLSYLHSAIDFSLQIPGYFIPFGILLGCGLAHACPAEAAVGQALLQVPAGAVRKLPHQC